jgi:hypothetical protein
LTRVVGLLAALVALAIPSSAQALTFSPAPTAAPANPQAGANSNFNIGINFGESEDQVQDLRIGLPPGMVANPTVVPQCSEADLMNDACDPASRVGALTTNVSVVVLVLPVPLPQVTGDLYNVVPRPGEPARFGAVLRPTGSPTLVDEIILPSAVELRTSDFGLDTVINDIPDTASTTLGLDLPVHVTAMTVQLFGEVNGQPFARNPTSCGTKTTNFSANSYADPSTFASSSATFQSTNCGALPFSPSFSARMGSPGQNSPLGKPPVSSVIEQDADEAGLQKAEVFLPPDLGVDLNQLNEFCPTDQFNAAACPPNSVVGSAIATSPLLTQPLTGPVTVVQAAVLPDIGLNLGGPLSLNLRGTLDIAGSVTFSGLPDIPISHFELNFVGGPDGLNVANRELCLPPPPLFRENFTGHNGATTSLETPATVEGGCGPVAKKCKTKAKGKKKGKKSDASAAKKKKKKNPCKKKKKKRKKR